MNEKKSIFSLSLIGLLLFSIIIPTYAEVSSLNIGKVNYIPGDEITFSGTVEDGSTGLVTIVIRDSNDEFVLLTQAAINHDYSFERSIDINHKFTNFGIHNATAFIFNMTDGQSTSFELFVKGSLSDVPESQITNPTEYEINIQETTNLDENNNSLPKENLQIISEKEDEKLADFVDPDKDPQYYLDRYYNEPAYKDWFNRNYPDFTIEEAVGLSTADFEITETIENIESVLPEEIIPDAEAISVIEDPLILDNIIPRETALFGLALGGLVVLFTAVYGIKRRVDTNSENISQNRESIRKKMFGSLLGKDPVEVVKDRLAHGEITVEEYNRLKNTLQKK